MYTYPDPSLGDGDGLLFHGLMDSHLVLGVHLVKLINAADAIVSQHEGASLDHKLMGLLILHNGSSQTCTIRPAQVSPI
ncbi:hypothetical protein DPMN_078470 [Dreissena polymorpha]|uniref:Uncharacterized protein n=1 Tax=Dreissena polymorpha TaxID=45954 RepID=A0A9D3YR90_DREPO|nr:hypothetical protein DPMN_078470 [Dreissena polymorpha]